MLRSLKLYQIQILVLFQFYCTCRRPISQEDQLQIYLSNCQISQSAVVQHACYFLDVNVSQGSAATRWRCGGIFNDSFMAYFLENLTVNTFLKWVIFYEDRDKSTVCLFWLTVYICCTAKQAKRLHTSQTRGPQLKNTCRSHFLVPLKLILQSIDAEPFRKLPYVLFLHKPIHLSVDLVTLHCMAFQPLNY